MWATHPGSSRTLNLSVICCDFSIGYDHRVVCDAHQAPRPANEVRSSPLSEPDDGTVQRAGGLGNEARTELLARFHEDGARPSWIGRNRRTRTVQVRAREARKS